MSKPTKYHTYVVDTNGGQKVLHNDSGRWFVSEVGVHSVMSGGVKEKLPIGYGASFRKAFAEIGGKAYAVLMPSDIFHAVANMLARPVADSTGEYDISDDHEEFLNQLAVVRNKFHPSRFSMGGDAQVIAKLTADVSEMRWHTVCEQWVEAKDMLAGIHDGIERLVSVFEDEMEMTRRVYDGR